MKSAKISYIRQKSINMSLIYIGYLPMCMGFIQWYSSIKENQSFIYMHEPLTDKFLGKARSLCSLLPLCCDPIWLKQMEVICMPPESFWIHMNFMKFCCVWENNVFLESYIPSSSYNIVASFSRPLNPE